MSRTRVAMSGRRVAPGGRELEIAEVGRLARPRMVFRDVQAGGSHEVRPFDLRKCYGRYRTSRPCRVLIFSYCSAQMRNIDQPNCRFMKKIVHVEIDRIDRGILDALQRDGSLSAADVASQVGLSTTTCWRRIQQLERSGVIKQRVALLDRSKLGLDVIVVRTGQAVDTGPRRHRAVRPGDPRPARGARLLHADRRVGLLAAHRHPRHEGVRGVLPRPPVQDSQRAIGELVDRRDGVKESTVLPLARD